MGIEIDTDNVEIVITDDAGCKPAQYQEFLEILSKEKAETVSPHRPIDHVMNRKTNYTIPFTRIYNLSEFTLETPKVYIEKYLGNCFIQRSPSSAAVPRPFENAKDRGLQLSVNYRPLNLGTVKNRYPLSLISELISQVREAWIFSKLDLQNASHLIRIRERNVFTTALQSSYGQFRCWVMPFGLTNAPEMFQAYMEDCLWPHDDDLSACYLQVILIYSTNQREHKYNFRKVLQCLQNFGLYSKTVRCQFRVREVGFLGFVNNLEGIAME